MPDLPRPRRSVYDGPHPTREQTIAAYRRLADLLDEHPNLPAPSYPEFSFYVSRPWEVDDEDNRREVVAEFLRAFPGSFTRYEPAPGESHMMWQGELEGILVNLRVGREAVCERVVLGVETVEVPATPERVIPAEPARVEEREVVEWRCAPVLTVTEDGAALGRIAEVIRTGEEPEPNPNDSCGRCGQPYADHVAAESWTASCRERGGFRPMGSPAESLPGTVVPS